jgi:Rieske Fe-S protein
MNDDALDRRHFVAACAAICGSTLLAGCVAMVTHPVPVAAGRVRIRLADHPELARADGAIKLQPAGLPDPVYVLALGGDFAAVSPICTHRGCTVDVSGARLVCPCHGSTYDRGGAVLKGPAQRALHRFPLTRSGDELVIEVGE